MRNIQFHLFIILFCFVLFILLSKYNLEMIGLPGFVHHTISKIPIVKQIDTGDYSSDLIYPIDFIGIKGCINSGILECENNKKCINKIKKRCKEYDNQEKNWNPSFNSCYQSGHPMTCHQIYFRD